MTDKQQPVAWAVYKGDECLRVHEQREWAEDWARAEAHFGSVGPYHIRELFAAPPAQPAEPVQRLSDERAAFEAWHNEYRTQELVRRDDTYYNTHVRCRWEGWQARAIESALQPGWRDIESAPKDGSKILLAKYGWSNDAGDAVQGSDEWKRRILDQTRRKYGLWWCVAGHWSARWNNWNDGVEPSGLASPTHWMPLPPAPKATK